MSTGTGTASPSCRMPQTVARSCDTCERSKPSSCFLLVLWRQSTPPRDHHTSQHEGEVDIQLCCACRWWVVFLQFPLVVAIICALIGWMGAVSLHSRDDSVMYYKFCIGQTKEFLVVDRHIIARVWVYAGGAYNALARFRLALIGLLATSLALHMWATNVTLNLAGTLEPRDSVGGSDICCSIHCFILRMSKGLVVFLTCLPGALMMHAFCSFRSSSIMYACGCADSDATPYLSKSEVTRARITLVGFAVESLFTASTPPAPTCTKILDDTSALACCKLPEMH